ADLKGYFDSIPQEGLMERIKEKIADGRVLKLVEQMLHAGVMESAKGWHRPTKGLRKERSSAHCYQTSIWTDWTGRWPETAMKWRDMRMTSSSCVAASKKPKRP